MGSAQGQQHLALKADGEPVCDAEQPVDGLDPRRQVGRLLGHVQRALPGIDLTRVTPGIATELGAVFEDQPVLIRHLPASRPVPVLGEPAAVERLESVRRRAVRPVARADDVIDEIAFIVDEHLPARADPRRVARHDVVVMELYDLRGAAELVR